MCYIYYLRLGERLCVYTMTHHHLRMSYTTGRNGGALLWKLLHFTVVMFKLLHLAEISTFMSAFLFFLFYKWVLVASDYRNRWLIGDVGIFCEFFRNLYFWWRLIASGLVYFVSFNAADIFCVWLFKMEITSAILLLAVAFLNKNEHNMSLVMHYLSMNRARL